jgi:hypothetical protein
MKNEQTGARTNPGQEDDMGCYARIHSQQSIAPFVLKFCIRNDYHASRRFDTIRDHAEQCVIEDLNSQGFSKEQDIIQRLKPSKFGKSASIRAIFKIARRYKKMTAVELRDGLYFIKVIE